MTSTTRNQAQIVDQLINDDIFVNASQMVNELSQGLTLNSASFGELWPECLDGEDFSELPEGYDVRATVGGLFEVESADDVWTADTEEDALRSAWDDSGEEPPRIEALQHWLVSDYLADELESVGALVARDVLGFNVWGRTECGQCLTMDADLNRVAANILARTAI